MAQTSSTQIATGFEIRFQSLFREGRALTFPCNLEGHVDLDVMSERARNNYFFACATIGLEYAVPVVKPSELFSQPVICAGVKVGMSDSHGATESGATTSS